MIRTKENDHLFRYQTNKQVRADIDKCLHKINALRAQYIGTDSTKEDLLKLGELLKPLKAKIKALDEQFYETAFLEDVKTEM